MYKTNSVVRNWLTDNGYNDIHFFPHTRFIKDYHFQGCDFDGIASKDIRLILFQCKTNGRATKKMIEDYKLLSEKFGIQLLWFNNNTKDKKLEINNELSLS
jgi:hypothetical protein